MSKMFENKLKVNFNIVADPHTGIPAEGVADLHTGIPAEGVACLKNYSEWRKPNFIHLQKSAQLRFEGLGCP